jgi:alkylresorcinol/alkylpyrone synthase
MPNIISTSKIDFEYVLKQEKTKEFAKNLFAETYSNIDKLMDVFDNTTIKTRNLSVPVDFFDSDKTFKFKNDIFIKTALEKSIESINICLDKAKIKKEDITDIIFISTTGLATPSLDALIINKMHLNPYINRLPIWGLGCAGGVSGIAKADIFARANPNAVVLVVAVELCSLTFIRNDLSKSNFIATSLFSDGIASCIVTGDNSGQSYNTDRKKNVQIISSQSRLYYDALDVMGWTFMDNGFKVLFSKDIPTIVNQNVKKDIEIFLTANNLSIPDIKNFIFHPGGAKVIKAYEEALNINGKSLDYTKSILEHYGNMSSVTVLYVLDKFLEDGFEDGYGLLLSLGPGFSSEMVLISMSN